MWIRNNSNKTWDNYNCGKDQYITVIPNSTFEVSQSVGELLLKNLGHANWLVEVDKPVEALEFDTPVAPTPEVEQAPEVVVEPTAPETPAAVKPFCDQCDSKGVRHKKECPLNIKKPSGIDPVGGQEEAAKS